MMKTGSKLTLATKSFEPGGMIPVKYTCDGEDFAPYLAWSGMPEKTESFVLIVDDPDAPGRAFTHWVVFNMPPTMTELEDCWPAAEIVKKGASQGLNDFGMMGYGGPCPPPGKPHRYVFHLYAIDTVLDLPSGVSKNVVQGAIKGHVLAEGELIGKYGRL